MTKLEDKPIPLDGVSHLTIFQTCEVLRWTKARARRELEPGGLLHPWYCTVLGKHMLSTAAVLRIKRHLKEKAHAEPDHQGLA